MNLKTRLLFALYTALPQTVQGLICLCVSAVLSVIALLLPPAISDLRYPMLFAGGFVAGHGMSLLEDARFDTLRPHL